MTVYLVLYDLNKEESAAEHPAKGLLLFECQVGKDDWISKNLS
jgi:hypothetical protein